MTMLIIEPGLRLWGSERALLATIDALVAANGPVIMLVPYGAEIIGEISNPGVTVIERDFALLHHTSRRKRLGFMLMLARIARAHAIDRIYLNQGGLCRLVRPVARALGIGLVNHVRLREDVPRAARLRGTHRSPVTSIFISREMRALCPGPDRPDPFTSRSTAYDAYPMDPARANSAMMPRTTAVMPCVGRLEPLKGQDILIGAVAAARGRGIDIPVRLIGADIKAGAYETALRTLAATHGVADLVVFGGYSTDPLAELTVARFAPVPSRYEALGRVVIEAWECGAVPIVCASSGGSAEIVAASGGGIIYPENTAAALAGALIQAAAMTEGERLELLARGRDWMSHNLTIDIYAQQLAGSLFAARKPDEEKIAT